MLSVSISIIRTVDKMSKRDLVEELHSSARRNFPRRKTEMRGIADTIQADLVEMIPYAKENRNYRYILTAINIFSKMGYAIPLKNKTGVEVAQALKSLFDSLGYQVKYLHVDNGKEFYNETVTNLLKNFGIKRYSTYTAMKAAICERFNRTIKNHMWKEFSMNGNYKWLRLLDKIIRNYNHSYHRTIKMRPIDVSSANEQKLLNTVYNYRRDDHYRHQIGNTKFRIGDRVRMSKYKHVFEKAYTPNWTTEIFKIRKVQKNTDPVTYLLADYQGNEISGSVYEHELLLVKHPDLYLVEKILRRKGNQAYVKWLGFDSSHNSWVDKDKII